MKFYFLFVALHKTRLKYLPNMSVGLLDGDAVRCDLNSSFILSMIESKWVDLHHRYDCKVKLWWASECIHIIIKGCL